MAQATQSTPVGIDRAARIPLYHQIFVQLRDKIIQGEFVDGNLLPGERDISETFGVSRITAKRVLDEIAAAGLAVRRQGLGTVVSRSMTNTALHGTVDNLASSLKRESDWKSVRVHEFKYVTAPAEVREALGLQGRAEVQRVVRVCVADRGPFSHLTTFVPADIAHNWSRADFEVVSLGALFARSGVRVSRADESITATLAAAPTATRLEVPPGAPLLTIVRVMHDDSGRPVEYLRALYPPDRYRYSISLRERDAL